MANCLQFPQFCDTVSNSPIVSDTAKFVGSFFVSTFLCSAILCSYFILNNSPKVKQWLQPRMHKTVKKDDGTIKYVQVHHGLSVGDIATLSDSQLMEYVGLDGVVFLLFIKSCIKICIFCTSFAVLVLIPIYATANGNIDITNDDSNFIDMMNINNVADGSWRLWVCVFAAFAFTLGSLYTLYRDAGYVAKMVDRFLSQTHVSHYTVMVTDIPRQYQDQHKFGDLLQTVYPDKIEKVHVIRDSIKVHRLRSELKVCRRKLLEAIEYRNNEQQRMTMMVCNSWRDCFPFPRRTDCIHYYNLRVRDLEIELNHAASRPQYSATAFVQFKDLVTTSCCVSTQLFANTLHFKCALAPYPDDLQRQHLLLRDSDEFRSHTLINIIVLAMISVWIFLINSSVMLSNIQIVIDYFYGIYAKQHFNFLPDSFWIIVTSIMPTLLIKMWLMLLPVALRTTYNQLGVYKDAAHLNLKLMNKYYLCLIVMVLLSVVIVQIVSSSVDHIIHSLTNIFATMANSLSKTSTFFIQYMMITALIFDPITLFFPLQIRFLYRPLFHCTSYSPRDFRRLDYVYFFANLSLELIITVTYSVCSPMILLFSLMHFLMQSLIFKHMLITFYDATCSIGRFIYLDLLQNILYGLLLPIMTLIGLAITKKGYIAAILLIVLLTFILQIQQTMYVNTKMSAAFKCVCLQTASKMDTENQFRKMIKAEYQADVAAATGAGSPSNNLRQRRKSSLADTTTTTVSVTAPDHDYYDDHHDDENEVTFESAYVPSYPEYRFDSSSFLHRRPM